MDYLKRIIFLVCILGFTDKLVARDVRIDNVRIFKLETQKRMSLIQFDLSWESSWREKKDIGGEKNWDGAWVFFKYRIKEGKGWSPWQHVDLSGEGLQVPKGIQIEFGKSGEANKGIIVYRSSAGSGDVLAKGITVKCAHEVREGAEIEVKGYALEMVYIPAGAFYAGGAGEGALNILCEGGARQEKKPFLIKDEGKIIIGPNPGELYYDRQFGNGGDQQGDIPAEYPKGYKGFYLMKYELSQGEYCDFLNSLTPEQAINRSSNQYGNFRMYIKKSKEGLYGCDRNNNAGRWGEAEYSRMNEADDGQWIVCHYLSWMDIAAYADWAGLRPYTELEYEKAARGPGYPVAGEYAWGSGVLGKPATKLLKEGTKDEEPDEGNSNYYGCYPQGPYRSGSYENKGTDRATTGRSYYGAYDLSGNVWERVVTIGNKEGRKYQGSHGDGELSKDGSATNEDWPGWVDGEITGSRGSGHRGGCWFIPTAPSSGNRIMRISDRSIAAMTCTVPREDSGCRLTRTKN